MSSGESVLECRPDPRRRHRELAVVLPGDTRFEAALVVPEVEFRRALREADQQVRIRRGRHFMNIRVRVSVVGIHAQVLQEPGQEVKPL